MSVRYWLLLVGMVLFFMLSLKFMGRARRALLRKRVRAALREQPSDLHDHLELKDAQGPDATRLLNKLYGDASHVDAAKKKRALALMDALNASDGLGYDAVDRILPRLVSAAMLRELRASSHQELASLRTGVDDLHVVFVLEGNTSVTYLSSRELQRLDYVSADAYHHAVQNLAATFDREVVRQTVLFDRVKVIRNQDTYDAARVLIVPHCLEKGETVVALIPDRDTLVLLPPPPNGDWSELRRLAKNATGTPLYTKPLLVTAAGLAPAPDVTDVAI